MASHGNAQVVSSDQEFDSIIANSGNKVVAVDFFATWCGPCKAIAPLFASLSMEYKNAVFLKVDVDKLSQTAQKYSVSAMPTFMFFKNGSKIHEFKGANPDALKQAVQTYAGVDSSQGSGEEGDLFELLDTAGTHCLNEQKEHNCKNIFKRDDSYLESDCDEQLLLTLAFRGIVKVHTIKIKAPQDGRAPKRIKLFVNQRNMDFNNAESLAPAQEIEIKEGDFKEGTAAIPLKFVKFQNVTSLTFFVDQNQGNKDTTAITSLAVLGNSDKKITKVEGVLE